MPTAQELAILRRSLDARLTEYRANLAAAKKLLAVGDTKADPNLDPAELAAYTAVCNLLLNLDESLTKE